jgi:flavin reductase (DIM6/NTAB) family NADH-FMN oxidoreductase RutF
MSNEKSKINIQTGISFGRGARSRDRDVNALDVSNPMGVDSSSLWDTAKRFASGVTVVTTANHEDEGYLGLTVSAFNLISLEPPLVMVSINNDSALNDAITISGYFGVSVLGGGQEILADTFAGRMMRPDPHFADVPHRTALTGAPLLQNSLATFDCTFDQSIEAGDHQIILGRVVAVSITANQDDPLLYFTSQYRRLAP